MFCSLSLVNFSYFLVIKFSKSYCWHFQHSILNSDVSLDGMSYDFKALLIHFYIEITNFLFLGIPIVISFIISSVSISK